MKAVFKTQVETAAIKEIKLRPLKMDEIRLKVDVCGI